MYTQTNSPPTDFFGITSSFEIMYKDATQYTIQQNYLPAKLEVASFPPNFF